MRTLFKISCWVFVTLSCYTASAAVFVVTSTLDTGPGSLREAITLANSNGIAITDTIKFDLPTRRGPVTLLFNPNAPLPALTSNIVIDGSSQTGGFIGATNAKVGVKLEGFWTDNTKYYCAFQIIDATNVQIYGLAMTALVADRNTGAFPDHLYGVHIRNSNNIIIGSPGKGNFISGWAKAINADFFRSQRSHHITVQSNIMGTGTDGVSPQLEPPPRPGAPAIMATNGYGCYFEQSSDIFVGGETPEEGNLLSSGVDIFCAGSTATNDTISIINNKLGLDVRGNNIEATSLIGISIQAYTNPAATTRANAPLIIRKNQVGGTRGIGISLADVNSYFAIEQNQVLGKRIRSGSTIVTGISLAGCNKGIIGDVQPGNENIITWCSQAAINNTSTSNITIRYNSTSCNTKRAIQLNNWAIANGARPKPYITVNSLNQATGALSGTTLPNSVIDLYEDDNCPACEGKTHLGITTTADALGRWTITNTSIVGKSLVATATDPLGATSEYSAPEIDDVAINIKPVTCSTLGSICGLKIISGSNWEWRDETGTVVGTDTCLNNIPAGTYKLYLPIGIGTCQEEYTFVVPDNLLKIDSAAGVVKTNTRCGKANGGICGITAVGATAWAWENTAGTTISTDACLSNAPAGSYRFRVTDGSCTLYTAYYTLADSTPRINAANITTTPTTCNKNNGSITGATFTGASFSTIQWVDAARNVVGTTKDLFNIYAGTYKLLLLDNTAGCGDSTSFITVAATPAPTLITTALAITNATCNRPNGSVSNITTVNTVGTVTLTWVDETNTIVGNALNLNNAKPGKYRLKLKDQSGCDTVYSPEYTIINNGDIQLDSSALKVTPAGCAKSNGAITGLKITGATSWQWRNTTTNTVVGNNEDILDLPVGTYQLTATNATYGCSVQSYLYTIGQAPPVPLTVTKVEVKQPSCNTNNGSITISTLSKDPAYYTFHWWKNTTTPAGTSLAISNLSPGTYQLMATDTNGCEQKIYERLLSMQSIPKINAAVVYIGPDECGMKTGSITNLQASSTVGSLTYQWHNSNNQVVGTSPNLTNATAGDYYLTVTDINGCSVNSDTYNIPQIINPLPAPLYEDLTIGRNTDATLEVKNKRSGVTYQLFDAANNLVQENTTGTFIVKKVPDNTYYSIKYTTGICTSTVTRINITVVDITTLDIPNLFTPNNDGINDEFRIGVTGYFKLNGLKIFNRWGQLVYETKDLKLMWNGKHHGQNVAVGTYYWVLEGIDNFGKALRKSGSVTIIR